MKSATRLLPLAALIAFSAAVSLSAQTELVSDSLFPAALEFKELKATLTERDLKDHADLGKLPHAPALLEVGLKRLVERTYTVAGGGQIEISIMTLGDARGAYSAFTFLGPSGIRAGPPGSFYADDKKTLAFASGNYCVLVRSTAAEGLARRVAMSVANRIGNRESNPPSLIRHVPANSCDPGSIRYLLGPVAIATFGSAVGGTSLKVPGDVEVAQVSCISQGQSAILSLLSFPTIQLAEEYFESGSLSQNQSSGKANLYMRQTGPLVAILDGNFSPETADKTLGSIQFSYSIKWIYDKSNQQSRVVWGVPVKLLGTVVRSILFTVLLCLMSLVAGVLIAAGRVIARRHGFRAADTLIRLKLDEN
jgi:hypothetical protein